MKQFAKDLMFSLCAGMLVPGLLLRCGVALRQEPAVQPEERAPVYSLTPLPVLVCRGEETPRQEDMDAYLVGVLLGELPASFSMDAMKAQAVVARTYARKAYITGGKHGDGSVCTDPGCCQAWVSEEAYLESGGREEDLEIFRAAVLSTSGQVLLYEGKLIEATYFSCSGGRTEDAAAVWGADYPYLRAVDSPGEEEAGYYRREYSFSLEDLEDRLDVTLGDTPVEQVRYTPGGGVATAVIGEKEFSGTELRSVLELPSTAFTLEQQGDNLIFLTRGYGHRVGLSQFGADAMARAGEDYRQILAHYYPGTELAVCGEGG